MPGTYLLFWLMFHSLLKRKRGGLFRELTQHAEDPQLIYSYTIPPPPKQNKTNRNEKKTYRKKSSKTVLKKSVAWRSGAYHLGDNMLWISVILRPACSI